MKDRAVSLASAAASEGRYALFQDLSDWHPVDVIATSVQETTEHSHTHITRHSADGREELGLVAR